MITAETRIIGGKEYEACVYTPSFGAGWSTEVGNSRINPRDGRIVRWLLDNYTYDDPEELYTLYKTPPDGDINRMWYYLFSMNAIEDGVIACSREEGEVSSEELNRLRDFMISECGYPDGLFFDGGNDLNIAWIREDVLYHIKHHDGQESIVIDGYEGRCLDDYW